MQQDWRRDRYCISTDKAKLDIAFIHAFLSHSYWAEGIPQEIVERAIEHSLCFGIYENEQQIGFGRIVTDYATFAYISDVFISEPYRGRGLSKWLIEVMTAHPQLQGLRRWMLMTRDAHGLYQQFGFTGPKTPERIMEITNPDIYRRKQGER